MGSFRMAEKSPLRCRLALFRQGLQIVAGRRKPTPAARLIPPAKRRRCNAPHPAIPGAGNSGFWRNRRFFVRLSKKQRKMRGIRPKFAFCRKIRYNRV